jgi:hypothetical protein
MLVTLYPYHYPWEGKSLLQSPVNTSQSVGHGQTNHCYSHQSILVSLLVMDRQIIATLLQSPINTSQSIGHRQTNHCYSHQSILVSLLVIDRQIIVTVTSQY